jgi:hypothetical protein
MLRGLHSSKRRWRTNYSLRAIGLTFSVGPIVVNMASGLYAVWCGPSVRLTVGVVILALALAIAAVNFYLTFIRTTLYKRQHGSLAGQRTVLPLPILCTLLGIIGSTVGFGSIACAMMGVLAMLLDTGGAGWYAFLTWDSPEFWDDPIPKRARLKPRAVRSPATKG